MWEAGQNIEQGPGVMTERQAGEVGGAGDRHRKPGVASWKN